LFEKEEKRIEVRPTRKAKFKAQIFPKNEI